MNDDLHFQKLLSDEWDYRMLCDPITATLTGDHRYDDRLTHVTELDYSQQLDQMRVFRNRLDQIVRTSLQPEDQLNYDIFKRTLDDSIREMEFGGYYLPVAKSAGFHADFPELFQIMPFGSLSNYENYLPRLNAFDQLVQEYIGLMQAGIQRGFKPASSTLDGIESVVESQIVFAAEKSPLFQPFRAFPDSISGIEQARLSKEGAKAILGSVVTGYKKFLRFIIEEYKVSARPEPGVWSLPRGNDFYQHRIRMFTTLPLSAQEIHNTGMDEVHRIRAEMQGLLKNLGFNSDLKEFISFLRRDARFYPKTADELLEKTALVLKRMDGELPRLFRKLPRMPYGIKMVPEHSAPGNTAAYYFPPAGDGTRAGNYYVNTYDLSSRPFYEIEALSLHEAVPGHHLQIALQQELQNLPNFRRFGGFTAFIEGWALYAERLGLEVGFYQDPYSNFGRLSYEMWRACRLVVDTGIHSLGWTRQQAIDFMADNTSSTLLNIKNEVDRYIFWPGQALAYKIGELKISELRSKAEKTLGDRFDIRGFHDALLENGALPLDILERHMDDYIEGANSAALRT